MTTMTASETLDRYFLETRCKIIEIAASLDRIERGAESDGIKDDPRLERIRRSIEVLLDGGDDRARRCQMVCSLPFDESWTPPNRV